MTSLEKSIILRYLFLIFKLGGEKPINTCTILFCMYWYVPIYSEEYFWPQYMYHKMIPNNWFRWCPPGKLSHIGLEQITGVSLGLLVWFGCIWHDVWVLLCSFSVWNLLTGTTALVSTSCSDPFSIMHSPSNSNTSAVVNSEKNPCQNLPLPRV